jgi:hypothetical protein
VGDEVEKMMVIQTFLSGFHPRSPKRHATKAVPLESYGEKLAQYSFTSESRHAKPIAMKANKKEVSESRNIRL